MSQPAIVYLHGFGSTARSQKADALREQLVGCWRSYDVPELDGGDFPGLTMQLMRARAIAAVQRAAEGGPVLVIGSSLGGYLAALLAAERALPRCCGLVLVAPAFHFTDRWRERLGEAGMALWRSQGYLPFYHYGAERELPLGAAFLESCAPLPGLPGDPGVPVAIIHGRSDETVDWHNSLAYAEAYTGVELHAVAGDHRLTEPRHEALIAWCARDLMAAAER